MRFSGAAQRVHDLFHEAGAELAVEIIEPRARGVDGLRLAEPVAQDHVALGVAEKHNGTILLESNAWNGTTFHVVLSTVLPESTLFRAPRAPSVRAEEDPVLVFLADQLPKI